MTGMRRSIDRLWPELAEEPEVLPCESEPERWFLEPADPQVKALCAGCPQVELCGMVGRLEPYGIWGAMDPEERRVKRRREQRVTYSRKRAQRLASA